MALSYHSQLDMAGVLFFAASEPPWTGVMAVASVNPRVWRIACGSRSSWVMVISLGQSQFRHPSCAIASHKPATPTALHPNEQAVAQADVSPGIAQWLLQKGR